MADEIRNNDPKVRVVRLLGHRDDAGAWEIRDFLKRSVKKLAQPKRAKQQLPFPKGVKCDSR
jgi:hypothetical protein